MHVTKANLTILIGLYYIKYVFESYYEADINQTRYYVCSPVNERFAVKLF